MIPKGTIPITNLASQSHPALSPAAAGLWTTAPHRRIRPTPCPSSTSQRRHATTSGSPSNHEWPKSCKPSPYEIFGQHRHAPYSKAKFYELVKIYHPDTHQQGSLDTSVSEAVRLERYRLIVAANTILSDPMKRRSYDRFGLGWDGPAGMESTSRSASHSSWRDQPGNASMNATWEDWERWYAERDGRVYAKQQPVYMSNGMFVFVLCLLVMVGSVGQARRASASTMHLVEAREQKDLVINDGLRRRQVDQATLNRHERVEHFLRQRDSWRLGDAELHVHHERSKQPAPSSEPRNEQ